MTPRAKAPARRPRRGAVAAVEAPAACRWALVYRFRGQRLAWLVVEDVPAEVKRAEVVQSLTVWRGWHRYQPPTSTGSLATVPEARWGELGGVDAAPRVSWGELAPEQRRLTVTMAGPDHALLVMAARRHGMSLQDWATSRLTAAAAAELQPAAS